MRGSKSILGIIIINDFTNSWFYSNNLLSSKDIQNWNTDVWEKNKLQRVMEMALL